MITVPIKLLYPDSKAPFRKHMDDAGMDFYLHRIEDGDSNKTGNLLHDFQMTYYTGIAMAIPRGHVGLLFMRSSVVDTPYTLRNCVGVIDSTYRGEIKATMEPTGTTAGLILPASLVSSILESAPTLGLNAQMCKMLEALVDGIGVASEEELHKHAYKIGERFCQMVIFPIPQVDTYVLGVDDKLPDTERGEGGYGSTGRS
jgi:dUTPase